MKTRKQIEEEISKSDEISESFEVNGILIRPGRRNAQMIIRKTLDWVLQKKESKRLLAQDIDEMIR